MKQPILFNKLGHNDVQCLACAWYCRVKPGQIGICATRINNDGKLNSLVNGKTTGLALDPVEKKPLHHFLPGAKFLSFGTVGCNFGCRFCQNDWMSQINKQNLSGDITDIKRKLNQIIDSISTQKSPQEIVDAAISLKADGIAYTYNEPSVFIEYAADTAKLAHENGLANVFVSNGFESIESFDLIKNYLDAINIDLKGFSDKFYARICKAKINPVKANIKRFFNSGIITEVTTLIIPGFNDSDKELTDIAEFLTKISPDIPWHISAFYPAYQMLDVPSTTHQTLLNAYGIGKKADLNYMYVGNIPDSSRESTYCPKCQSLLIERYNYDVKIRNIDLNTGTCISCNQKIYGKWH
jgi:pyruvate formate lyase activating enzyme